jgi:protein-S-isoprenylcysteine O-methyltransferase Ste14
MAAAALVLYTLWALLTFGARTVVQIRRTGDSGFRGSGGRPGSAEWWARVLFVAALATGVAAPVAALSGSIEPLAGLDGTAAGAVAGSVLAVVGIAGTLWAQLAMGDSWRIGVDNDERTDLVLAGPFRLVRDPIFTTMGLTAVGLAAMVPNVIALAGLGLLVVALQLQVRVVEEPYLRATHGDSYSRYAARTGRFLPALGRRPD